MSRPETHHETGDLYHRVVAQISEDWRVVECRDRIQWIVQCRKKGGAERPWRGVSFCTTRNALIRLCARLEPGLDPKTRAILEAFPETFGGNA